MAHLQISDPDVLVRLPRTTAADGRSWFSIVHGFSAVGKKRRLEICAAIDGNSVNVYELRNGRAVASHVVPPDSTFSCSPLSIREKHDSGINHRRTYCVMKRQENQFIQLYQSDGETSRNSLSAPSHLLEQDLSPVVQIDILPPVNVIAVFRKNGNIQLLKPDLSSIVSHGQLAPDESNTEYISFVCLSVVEASKSVLKARADIISSLQSDSTVFCGIAKVQSNSVDQPEDMTITVWSCTPSLAGNLVVSRHFSHKLPIGPKAAIREQDSACFSSKNTRIIVRSGSKFVKYNISKALPQLISDVTFSSPGQTSSIEITDDFLLCANPSSLQLYNSKFGSVQASNDAERAGLKRKRASQASRNVSFIAYFPDLHRAIATNRNSLMAVDLQFPRSENASVALRKSTSLLSNIGKGATLHSQSKHIDERGANARPNAVATGNSESDEWIAIRKKLDAAVNNNDSDSFESTFLEYVNFLQRRAFSTPMLVPDHHIDYVLSKVFTRATISQQLPNKDQLSLSAEFGGEKLLEWLSSHGYLASRKVLGALTWLEHTDYSNDDITICVIDALRYRSPSLEVLRKHLTFSPLFSTRELCIISRLLLRVALEHNNVSMSSITANPQEIDQIDAGPISTLSPAVAGQYSESAHISTCLILALKRLAEGDNVRISANLKSTCKQQELLALVQILRQQLFHSGQTRSLLYQSLSDAPVSKNELTVLSNLSDKSATDLSVNAITILMSCCIDALGSLGLVSTGLETRFIQTIIPELSSEITRAVEASVDAAYLQGILRETLRFLGSTSKYNEAFSKQNKSTSFDRLAPREPGTIHTIYSESTNDKLGGTGLALPISLRHDGGIDSKKIRKGDGRAAPRSRREMGMLQDRLRGLYSFEHLVL